MRCISLWRPWASLIAIGVKTVETRSWSFPERFIGEHIAIHATATLRSDCRAVLDEEPFKTDLREAGLYFPNERYYGLPLGAVIAIARVGRVRSTNDDDFIESLTSRELAYGSYSPDRFGWVLSEVRALSEPILAKGLQGLWEWRPPEGFTITP